MFTKIEDQEEYIKKLKSKQDRNGNVYVFLELGLEITRACQLSCKHCLKGEAQSEFMNRQTMENIFSHTLGVRTLSLLSGETSLATKQIKMLNESLVLNNVTVECVNIYTNAVDISDEYVRQLKILRNYVLKSGSHHGQNIYNTEKGLVKGFVTKNFPLKIIVSNDKFHKEARKEYYEKINKLDETDFYSNVEKLAQEFPVRFHDSSLVFNIGKAQTQKGIKYNPKQEKLALWKAPEDQTFGVKVLHVVPHIGISYDGGLCDVMQTYLDQDKTKIMDLDKTLEERLLKLPNMGVFEGNKKQFVRWLENQHSLLEQHKLNPLNYTLKSTQVQKDLLTKK